MVRANKLAAGESEAVLALGSRTTTLHPELKRHRAWWREILSKNVLRALAERVSSPPAAEKGHAPTSLLVDGERHPHVDLLEDLGAYFSAGGTIGGGGASGVVGALATVVGDAAGSDLESKELAAIICGSSEDLGKMRLVRRAVRETRTLTEGHRDERDHVRLSKLGLTTAIGGYDDTVEASTAFEVRRLPQRGRGGSILQPGVGGDESSSGRVALLQCKDLDGEVAALVTKVKRAKCWHDRHPACFLPVAWAVCAAVAAKWPSDGDLGGGPEASCEDGAPGCRRSRVRARHRLARARARKARRPSPFSILALLAAFLDKDSKARGVSKEAFGAGPSPTCAKQNPNVGEIFLRFCSYVRQLGVTPGRRKSAGPPATLNLLDSGELEMSWSAAAAVTAAPKGEKPQRSDREAETETEELVMGQGEADLIRVQVGGKVLEDLVDAALASDLRRACAAIERSLTPDGARGLPVWGQDIRWSLLGFAFEQSEEENDEESEGRVGEKREGQPSYLDWMEIRLQMCMNPGIDEMPGMYGFNVTGRAPLAPKAIANLDRQHAADVLQARTADVVFSAALQVGGGSQGQHGSSGANGDSSDSLFGGSASEEDEELDGEPMVVVTASLPLQVNSPAAAEAEHEPSVDVAPQQGTGETVEVGEGTPEDNGVSGKVGAVLALGDRLMKEAAGVLASAKATTSDAKKAPPPSGETDAAAESDAVPPKQSVVEDEANLGKSVGEDSSKEDRGAEEEEKEKEREKTLAKQKELERRKAVAEKIKALALKKKEETKRELQAQRAKRELEAQKAERELEARRAKRKLEAERARRAEAELKKRRRRGRSPGRRRSISRSASPVRRRKYARRARRSPSRSSSRNSSSSSSSSSSRSRSRSSSSSSSRTTTSSSRSKRSSRRSRSGDGDRVRGRRRRNSRSKSRSRMRSRSRSRGGNKNNSRKDSTARAATPSTQLPDKERVDSKTSAAEGKPPEALPSSTSSKDHGDGAASGGTAKPSLTSASPDGDGAASGGNAKPALTSPAGDGVASAEKEADAAQKMPEPEGWSEWRALSSDDESNRGASAGGDVSDGGPTTRNVRGTDQGFQISVRRGSSLERRSGDTDVGRRGAHRERSTSPRSRSFGRSSRSRDRGSRYDRGDTSRRSTTSERYRDRGGYADYAGRANRSRSRERGGSRRPTERSRGYGALASTNERAAEPSRYAALADDSQTSKRARVDATATTRAAAARTAALSAPKKQESMVLPAAGKVPPSTTGGSKILKRPDNAGAKTDEVSQAVDNVSPKTPSVSQQDRSKISKTGAAEVSSRSAPSSKSRGSADSRKEASQATNKAPAKTDNTKVAPTTSSTPNKAGSTISKSKGAVASGVSIPQSKSPRTAGAKEGGVSQAAKKGPLITSSSSPKGGSETSKAAGTGTGTLRTSTSSPKSLGSAGSRKGGASQAAKKVPSKMSGSSQKGGSETTKAAGTGTLRISTPSPKSPGSAGSRKGGASQAAKKVPSKTSGSSQKGGSETAKAAGTGTGTLQTSTPSPKSPDIVGAKKGGASQAAKVLSKTSGSSQKGESETAKAAGTGTLRISTPSPKSPGSAGSKQGEVSQAGKSALSKAPNAPNDGPKIAKAPGSLGSTPSSTSPGNTDGKKGQVSKPAKAPSTTPKTSQKERSTVAKKGLAGSSTGSTLISKTRGSAGATKDVSPGAKSPPANAPTAKNVPPKKSNTSQKSVSSISGAGATVASLGSTPNSKSPGSAGAKKNEAPRVAKKAPSAASSVPQKDRSKVSKTGLAKTSSGATTSPKDPGTVGAKQNSVSQAVNKASLLAKVTKTSSASQTGGTTKSKAAGDAALLGPTPPSKSAVSASAKKDGVSPKIANGLRESGFGDRSREHSGGEKEEGEIDLSMEAHRGHMHGAAAWMSSATNPNPALNSRSPPVTGFVIPPPPRRGMNEERAISFSMEAMRRHEHAWNSLSPPVTGFVPPPPSGRGMNGEGEIYHPMEAMRRQEHAAAASMSLGHHPNPAWNSISPPVTRLVPPPPPRRDINGEGEVYHPMETMRRQDHCAATSMPSANNPNAAWNSISPPVTRFVPPPPPRDVSMIAMRGQEHAAAGSMSSGNNANPGWNSLSPPAPGNVPPPPPARGKNAEGQVDLSMEAMQRQEHAAASTSSATTPNPASSESPPVSGKVPPPPPSRGKPGKNAAKKRRRKARLKAAAEEMNAANIARANETMKQPAQIAPSDGMSEQPASASSKNRASLAQPVVSGGTEHLMGAAAGGGSTAMTSMASTAQSTGPSTSSGTVGATSLPASPEDSDPVTHDPNYWFFSGGFNEST